jgi:transposase-like protein
MAEEPVRDVLTDRFTGYHLAITNANVVDIGSRISLALTYIGKLRVPACQYHSPSPVFVCSWSTSIRDQVVCSSQSGHHRTRILFRIFRQAIYDSLLCELQEIKLSGQIELDEALFGGRRKGGEVNAAGVLRERASYLAFTDRRNGKVITFPVSDRRRKETLIPLIRQHTRKGSLYYSDDHTAYATLNLIGKHQIIAHSREEYVRREDAHINGIEGFWSYAKTWLYHYRGVPKQYFHLYLKEGSGISV